MSQHGKKLSTSLIAMIVGGMVLTLLIVALLINWMPTEASTFASGVDFLFYYIYYVAVFFTLLIAGTLLFFLLYYKQTDKAAIAPGKATHSTALELTWTIIPIFLVLSFFALGFKGFIDMAVPDAGAYKIIALAKQWSWGFMYPNGYTDSNLHIVAGQPVEMTLESSDVIHSLYIKQFRVKKDVVPGRYNTMWFKSPWDETIYQNQLDRDKKKDAADQAKRNGQRAPGDVKLRVTQFDHPVMIFDLYCAEYCGKSHSQMNRQVIVHKTQEDFDKWLAFYSRPENVYENPVAYGKSIYDANCKTCHSIDGSAVAGGGPSWKDLWLREDPLVGGGSWKDRYANFEQYIETSIHVPQKDIVGGYQGVNMSAFPSLGQRDLRAIMEFMKSISEKGGKPIGTWDTFSPPPAEGEKPAE